MDDPDSSFTPSPGPLVWMRHAQMRKAAVGFHHASIPLRMENTKPLRMNCRAQWKGLLSSLVLCALMAMSACQRDSPEEALRTQLQEMQSAAGEGRMGDFMGGVADDFVGNEGMDRAAMHNLLRMQALARSNFSVTTGPLQIQIQGEQASVIFDVVVAGGNRRLLPDSARAYSITSGWRIEAGEWRAYYAQWEPMP
ncbi:MAG: nuclear transport factor 2 family protein [Pseudoxanthomonas sp.]